jgi:hypothetical protein
LLTDIYNVLDWLGTVAGGVGVLLAAWGLLQLIPQPSRGLTGRWFGYSYFYSHQGMEFYKETILIRKSRLLPWKLVHETRPAGSKESMKYKWPIHYQPPWVYSYAFEPESGDRTADIGRLYMNSSSQYNEIISLHLGNSFEETVHSASAYLWVREQLDPAANESMPPTEGEEALFRQKISSFIRSDKEHFQVQLVPPQPLRRRSS